MPYNEFLEALSCRDYEAGLTLDLNGFTLPGDKPKYARDRVVDIKHVNISVTLDLDAKRLNGSVSHTFSPLVDDVSSFTLDAVELAISNVRLANGIPLQYGYADGRLEIQLDSPRHSGE